MSVLTGLGALKYVLMPSVAISYVDTAEKLMMTVRIILDTLIVLEVELSGGIAILVVVMSVGIVDVVVSVEV